MERIFAFGSNNGKYTSHALFPYRTLLSHSPDKGPYSWGFGYSKPHEELILKRRPFHLDGFNMFEPIEHNPISCGIGNMQTTECSRPLNDIMPFRYHDWFFAMLGSSLREHIIKGWLSGTLPAFLKRNIRGQSEQEHVFHLFLSYLHDSGILNAYSFPEELLATALTRTYDTWQLFLQDAGIENPRSAFVLTDGRAIIAMASHEDLMGYKFINGIHGCAYCRSTHPVDSGLRDHSDLRAVFLMADQNLVPQEFGLSPLPSDKIIQFDGKELKFLTKQ
ncbi:hypothetical protein KKF84_04165 [Myxococcota bacterium]|nr:hypothetical protein [Myxococcota bacterium]MBU1534490.1 hypothetical protein [Myxococcota bacterium]